MQRQHTWMLLLLYSLCVQLQTYNNKKLLQHQCCRRFHSSVLLAFSSACDAWPAVRRERKKSDSHTHKLHRQQQQGIQPVSHPSSAASSSQSHQSNQRTHCKKTARSLARSRFFFLPMPSATRARECKKTHTHTALRSVGHGYCTLARMWF